MNESRCAEPQPVLQRGTSTVALEDVHQFEAKRNATEAGVPLNQRTAAAFCVQCGVPGRGMRRSKHRVLIFNAAPAKTVRETNNGPICGCHHRSDAFYGSHGVFGRIDDVRRRFDE
jgi:hypothetical protein